MGDHTFDNVIKMFKNAERKPSKPLEVVQIQYEEGFLKEALEDVAEEEITPQLLKLLEEFAVSSFLEGFEKNGRSVAQMDDITAAQDFVDKHQAAIKGENVYALYDDNRLEF